MNVNDREIWYEDWTIYTTNYDKVQEIYWEGAADLNDLVRKDRDIERIELDRITEPNLKLIKLHGSLDWYMLDDGSIVKSQSSRIRVGGQTITGEMMLYEIIIGFPNRFGDGNGADPDLLRKLSTEDELSGIFNVLIIALRTLLRNGSIFVHEKTIEQRRQRHELAVNPLKYFIGDVLAEDSTESDKTPKDTLYEAYLRFCNGHKLAVESKENLGRTLKNRFGFQEGRDSSTERKGTGKVSSWRQSTISQTCNRPFEDVF